MHMVLWPYLGMTKGTQACQGDRGPGGTSILGVLQPRSPHRAPQDRLQDSCLFPSLQLKILWVTVRLFPESVLHPCVLMLAPVNASAGPQPRTLSSCPKPGRGPQTLSHLAGTPPSWGEASNFPCSTPAVGALFSTWGDPGPLSLTFTCS